MIIIQVRSSLSWVSGYSSDIRRNFFSDAFHSIIVYPQSTEDVVKIVNVATKYKIPVVPYASATSLEGHTRGHPTAGGICVDMSNMDKILEIHGVYCTSIMNNELISALS